MGRGVSVTETPLDRDSPSRQRPPWTETPPSPVQRPPDRDPPPPIPPRTVKIGRYASYWNAFLFEVYDELMIATVEIISRYKGAFILSEKET